jgi:hypothetical protein
MQPVRTQTRANLPDTSSLDLLKKWSLVPAVLLVLYGLWMTLRRASGYLRRDDPKKTGGSRFLRDDPKQTPIAVAPALLRNIRRMRRWLPASTRRLDIGKTVLATLDKAGFPQLHYAAGKQRPEYLALIDRSSGRDHQTALFNQLARDLSIRGQLIIDAYFYNGDPRVCTNLKTGKSTYLDELLGRNYRRHLLIFGDGASLWNPFTGECASWAEDILDRPLTALLTPTLEDWGPREEALRRRIVVRPATMDGLAQVLDEFEGRATPSPAEDGEGPPEYPAVERPQRVQEYIKRLRIYLGERSFQWLSACSVYAYLDSTLTVHLGRALDPTLLEHSNALKLFALPWFRKGSFPLALHQALWEGLDPQLRRRMSGEMIRLLKLGSVGTDQGAALEIIVQHFGLSPKERHELQRDEVGAKLAMTAGRSRVAFRLPAVVRNQLFHYGVPGLGLRSLPLAVLVVIAIVLAAAATLLPPAAGSLLATFMPPRVPPGWDRKPQVLEYIAGPFRFAGTSDDIEFTPDQTRVVTLNRADGRLFATTWDAQDGSALSQSELPTKGTVLASQLSLDGTAAIFSTSEPAVEVWNIDSREQLARLAFGPSKMVSLSSDGSVFAAADSKAAVIWNQSRELDRYPGVLTTLLVTANGKMALLETSTQEVFVRLPSAGIVSHILRAKTERSYVARAITAFKLMGISDGYAFIGDVQNPTSGLGGVTSGNSYINAAVSGNGLTFAGFEKNKLDLGLLNWATLTSNVGTIPITPGTTKVDVTGAHVVMDYRGRRFAVAWPNGLIKVFPVPSIWPPSNPALAQTEKLFSAGAGTFTFGMTPTEVNALLPAKFKDPSYNTMPIASEYAPVDVRYFWAPLAPFTRNQFPFYPLETWNSCWKQPQSYVTFLFSAKGLFRISLRLLPDCGQRVDLLRQLANSILVQNFNPSGPIAFRIDDKNLGIAGYIGAATSFEIFSPGSPQPSEEWIRSSFGGAYGPDTCKTGYVWREAVPTDHVCVTLANRQQAADDNQLAAKRRTGTTDTCIPDYVWRAATPTDHVCVTQQVHDQAQSDNAQAKSRLIVAPPAPPTGLVAVPK